MTSRDESGVATVAAAGGVKRRRPERALQAAVAEFLSLALPAGALAITIPGGDRQRTTAPGWISGTPDMCVLYEGRALFLELKAGKVGRVSAAQIACHRALVACGCPVAVCRSLDDVAPALREWGVPLKMRLF